MLLKLAIVTQNIFRLRSVRAGVAILLTALIAIVAQFYGPLSALDRIWLDAQFSTFQPKSTPVSAADPIIIGIDQAYVDHIDEPLALWHRSLAEVFNGLATASPAVVAIDVNFPNKRYDKIAPLGDPIRDYHRLLVEGTMQLTTVSPLILARIWNEANKQFEPVHLDFLSLIDMARDNGSAMASAELCADSQDQVVRRYPGPWCQPEEGGASFSAAVAATQGAKRDWEGLIDFNLGQKFQYISMLEVSQLAKAGNTARLKKLFGGRAVFIGGVFENDDEFNAPVPLEQWRPSSTDVHGVVLHAMIYRNMMNNRFIHPVNPVLLILSVLLATFFWLGDKLLGKAAWLTVFIVGTFVCSIMLFRFGWWFPPSATVAASILAFSGRASYDAWGHFIDKQRLQRSFAGYVSPAVMAEIVSGRLEAKQNDRRHLVVMFSDIRNFTTISERSEPDAVVALLTRYFNRMSKVIHRNNGTLDKFMGDGIMTLFGAPNVMEAPERAALDCAHQMLLELALLNKELLLEGKSPISIGIGINAGDAIVGNIGAGERHGYTAIGDTVNAAARLESLCKEIGYPIICSEYLWKTLGCPDYMIDCGEYALKGRSPMRIFAWNPQDL